ncbi:heterokaryon incompatibility protein-domain-containing protein [Hyaloscypha sp. PMI_1271]|nr:heterokaryon incompatibility protein-domain-containing protein [Hyaloscypha sp. PMI_1271]
MAQPKSFTYRPLGRRQIRLVTLLPDEDSQQIRCTLDHVSLSSKSDFEALSYVWGPDDLYASILINGELFSIRRNLWSGMVNSITVDKPLTIWIDAICINQDDIIERGAQVQIMGEIYQTAWRLRIWLGEHSSNTIPAMENFSLDALVDGGIKLRCRKGILEICQRPYWRRLWVIQEAVLGSEPIIHCGASVLEWAKFESFLNATFLKKLRGRTTHGPGYKLSPALIEIIGKTPAVEFMKAFRVTKSGGVRCSSLRSLITSFARSQAKDPRDMVYGLLALSDSAEDTDNFTPDYTKPPHEL